MKIESMDLWACPSEGHYPLILSTLEKQSSDIQTGELICEECHSVYKILDGIPIFLVLEEGESAQVKRTEIEARDQELTLPVMPNEIYEASVEAESVLACLRPNESDMILDAGCSLGRITRRVLETGAKVLAADFSHARLLALKNKTQNSECLETIVADVNHLPLRPNSFTKILSTQILEHLPTPELRLSFVSKLHDLLIHDGRLVLTVYNYHDHVRQRGYPREGYHDSGIFYHRYVADELLGDLKDSQAVKIFGIVHYVRGIYKLRRMGRLGAIYDHILERIRPVSLRYGSLLLAHATKKQTP